MRQEIISELEELMPGSSQAERAQALDRFASISNPSFDIEPRGSELRIMSLITADSFRHTGYSRKPGNITVNMRSAAMDGVEAALTIGGVLSSPYFIPLAAIWLWNKVQSRLTIDLKDDHAIAIIVMWENRDYATDQIKEDSAFEHFNRHLKRRNKPTFVRQDFELVLDELGRIGCIQKRSGPPVAWWLKERVRVTR